MAGFTVKLPNGTIVECDTAAQVRELAGEMPGMIAGAAAKKGSKRPRNFKSPGEGPKRLWAMAEWQSVLTGATKNNARSVLADLKRTNKRAFLDKEEEYARFVAFYADKTKTPAHMARDSIRDLYEGDIAEFTSLAKEFAKQPKAAAKPTKKKAAARRAGR